MRSNFSKDSSPQAAKHFREILFSARQLDKLSRMDGCRNNNSDFLEELMMNATNKTKYDSWSNGVGLVIRQRRVSIAIALGGLSMLGLASAVNQVGPLSLKKSEVLVSASARVQSTVLPDPQALAKAATPDDDQEAIGELVLDGLEFAVAGAEVSNQLGAYRQIGRAVSWLAQQVSQPEDARLVASTQPNDANLVSTPLLSTTEREMATWLLQNSPWIH